MGEGALRALFGFHWFVASALTIGLLAYIALPAAAASSTLPGIDVSHYNGEVDWSRVQGDGIRFAIAKATDGTNLVDERYAANKQQSETLGLAFTAYHFARPDASAGDAVAEADWFVANAKLTGNNLVPVLDLETSGGLSARKLTRWAKDWLGEVEAQLRVKATIYTTASFWRAHLGDTPWFADQGYRLWVAHWTTKAQPAMPAANWGGHGWTMWQYSSCGAVDGINGCVDLDRYNGTRLAPLKIKNNH
jgi:GH25 family lysozyme M1 (1,4-beta-N-acetylmuramidase)